MTLHDENHRLALRVANHKRHGNVGKRWTHEVVATYSDGRVFVVKRCMGEESARKARALAIRRTLKPYGVKVVGPEYTIRPYEPSR